MEPFSPPTPFAIERANRLLQVKSMPGYVELMKVSRDLADQVTAMALDYPGWDKDQAAMLLTRAKVAKEFHQALFAKVEEFIRAGIDESAEMSAVTSATTASGKKDLQMENAQDIIRESDRLRAEVISQGFKSGKIQEEAGVAID